MAFPNGTRVEVRGSGAHAWRAGEVIDDSTHNGTSWCVTLDSAINANAWSGVSRKYAGASFLSVVYIYKNSEVVDPGEFIKTEGS